MIGNTNLYRSPVDGSSPSKLGEAKSPRSHVDSGEGDQPQSSNGSLGSGSGPDSTSSSQGALGELGKPSSFVELQDRNDFQCENKVSASGRDVDDESPLESGTDEADARHEGQPAGGGI